jgi:hypothetical protein
MQNIHLTVGKHQLGKHQKLRKGYRKKCYSVEIVEQEVMFLNTG